MNNIPRITPEEQSFSTSSNSSQGKRIVRMKGKSVQWVIDLMTGLCKAVGGT